VLSEILRKPADEYREALRSISDKSYYLKKLQEGERLYNEVAEKHS
jgi:hypothetical protein